MERTDLLWFVCAIAVVVAAPAQVPAGEIVLHSFGCPPKGANPKAGVIGDSAGNFYGTAQNGGAANKGVVFKLDPAGHQTVLHSFMGGTDGAYPFTGVIRDPDGNLYGTTSAGGAAGVGVVYKLDSTGHETVLYSFTGGADGSGPAAGVVRDSAGNLYGTTYSGGTAGAGVVYRLDTTGHETVLYSFTAGADGGGPLAGVILDSAGNLYGTTTQGGTAKGGVVYKLDTSGHETVLYSFTGIADGAAPYAGVSRDSAGNLYGTTYGGGTAYAGVVYKLDPAGHETVLYTFTDGADGGRPYTGVIRDSAGNLYGTTYDGGTAYAGVVYKVDTTGHETVLYNFTGGADGGPTYPAGVIRDLAGNLYGTTRLGGAVGFGVVFKLDTTGKETVLYSFPRRADGVHPYAGVIRDSAGNLYGTTYGGGTADAGIVYKLDSTGHETLLHSFTGGNDGAYPYAGVIRDYAGNLYGTANQGGAAGGGVVFKLDTTGHETLLYSFTGGADGGNPQAGVIADTAGTLYGTASGRGPGGAGVVYKLDTAGHESVLYGFSDGTDGGYPYAGVIRDSAGNLYGTTILGGTGGWGVVYKVDTTGHETVLYSFTGEADGGTPNAGVIRDSAGNLYGTTNNGGVRSTGVVFMITP